MISLSVDGKRIEVPEGSSLLDAARAAGASVPNLCWIEGLDAYGGCRVCLVELEGARNGTAAACSTPAAEGQVVRTSTPAIRELRKQVLELLLATHHADCFNCRRNGDCGLQSLCVEYGVVKVETGLEVKDRTPDTSHPFFNYDKNKCIHCGKCVRVCGELQCSRVLEVAGRGSEARVVPAFEDPMGASSCVSCGNCVSNCPVGALVPKKGNWLGSLMVERRVPTTCGYCGVGCRLELLVRGNEVVGAMPLRGPANEGLLCVKGKFAYEFIGHPDRLTRPLLRKGGELLPVPWEEAYAAYLGALRDAVAAGGPDAAAGLSSARCTNEENYLFQKLFRAAVGTNNVDHCARLCHASTVTGLAKTLGSGAMTGSIADLDRADTILVTGSNTTESHPVVGARVRRAVARGARLVVIDPRRTELAAEAELFLRIRPGSNVAAYNALCAVILAEGLEDRAFLEARVEGLEALRDALRNFSVEEAARTCGVEAEDLRRAARIYAGARSASVLYAMGVTQQSAGTDGVVALANLALLCGKVGKPGSNLDPLRGQNNVQGACDMGCLPDLLPGYRKAADPAARSAIGDIWGVEPPASPGLTATGLVENLLEGGGAEGSSGGAGVGPAAPAPAAAPAARPAAACDERGRTRVRFLHVMGENPALSDPDLARTRRALASVDFLVVQDLFLTETAALADLVLPAACFAEKEGSFTNTERRVQAVRKAVEPPGEAKPDLDILLDLLERLGRPQPSREPAAILAEAAKAAPIYGGISLGRLGEAGLQWPCPEPGHPGTPLLHATAFPRGKARLVPVAYRAPGESPDADYPFLLTTGRLLYQYHTRTMTGRSRGLDRIAGKPYVELSREDAARLGIAEGQLLRLTSRRGSLEAPARLGDRVGPGVLFMPFHYAAAAANLLTGAGALDPEARIPEFKVSAVRLERAAGDGPEWAR